jgi:hypothetical protein
LTQSSQDTFYWDDDVNRQKDSKRLELYIYANYRISSYQTLPQIIPASLIIPSILITLCRRNVVFSNKIRIWRLHKIIISANLIWGNTVNEVACLVAKMLMLSEKSVWNLRWNEVYLWPKFNFGISIGFETFFAKSFYIIFSHFFGVMDGYLRR